jgi:hypothetical protein
MIIINRIMIIVRIIIMIIVIMIIIIIMIIITIIIVIMTIIIVIIIIIMISSSSSSAHKGTGALVTVSPHKNIARHPPAARGRHESRHGRGVWVWRGGGGGGMPLQRTHHFHDAFVFREQLANRLGAFIACTHARKNARNAQTHATHTRTDQQQRAFRFGQRRRKPYATQQVVVRAKVVIGKAARTPSRRACRGGNRRSRTHTTSRQVVVRVRVVRLRGVVGRACVRDGGAGCRGLVLLCLRTMKRKRRNHSNGGKRRNHKKGNG